MLVTYDFNILYRSAEKDLTNTKSKIETAFPLQRCMSDAVCRMFKSGRCNELNRYAFSTVKYHNPESLVFQHLPVKEEIINLHKNNRLEEINRMGNSIVRDTLTSVDIVEIVKCNGFILGVIEGLFCHSLEYNLYTEFVTEIFKKKRFVQNTSKRFTSKPS